MIGEYLYPSCLLKLLLTNRLLYIRLLPLMHRLATEEKDGLPALHWAVAQGHKPLVTLLLEKGADINSQCSGIKEHERTPLHLAASRGDTAMVQLLLKRGANVNLQTPKKVSALYLALGIEDAIFKDSYFYELSENQVKSQREEIIEHLIQNGANPNYLTYSRISSLHIAVITQSERIVRLLLDNGAEVDLVDSTGFTPLHTLVSSRDGCVNGFVRLLLEYGANINAMTPNGDTALHWAAAMAPNKLAVEMLLAGGVDIGTRNQAGNTALDRARAGYTPGEATEIIQLLEEQGSKLSSCKRRASGGKSLLLDIE